MKNKLILVLIITLLVSNLAWGYFYYSKKDQNNNNGVQLYTLQGTSKSWDIDNYKIVVTPDKVLRGHAKLLYKGNTDDIKDSNYFDITFYELDHENKKTVVYSKTAISENGTVSILENLDDVGTIKSPYSYDETLRTIDNYESSTAEISWKDNNGKMHSEEVNLDIIDKIIVDDK